MLIVLRTKTYRGVGLVSTMLALSVLALLVVLAGNHVSEYNFQLRQKSVAADLSRLIDASTDYISRNFKDLEDDIIASGVPILRLTPQDLINVGTLNSSFATTNDLGQIYIIYAERVDDGKLDVLVTTRTPLNDPANYNFPALYNYKGNGHIGIVSPSNPDYLAGPGLLAKVSQYKIYDNEPSLGETAVISHLSIPTVFSDYLYRTQQAGHALATTMETDLDLGTFDLNNAGDINGETLTLEQQLDVLGGVSVLGELNVGSLDVTGDTTLTDVTATEATFNNSLQTTDLAVSGETTASTIDVAAGLTANTGNFDTSVSAETLNTDTLGVLLFEGNDISIESATINDLNANRLIIDGDLSADSAAINALDVGGCTGC